MRPFTTRDWPQDRGARAILSNMAVVTTEGTYAYGYDRGTKVMYRLPNVHQYKMRRAPGFLTAVRKVSVDRNYWYTWMANELQGEVPLGDLRQWLLFPEIGDALIDHGGWHTGDLAE